MCNLTTQTTLKRVTVYKLVYKINNAYYSFYSGKRLSVGTVSKMPFYTDPNGFRYRVFERDYPNTNFYNPLMEGRTSGFHSKTAAELLYNENNYQEGIAILKIKLGGSICKGTAAGISTEVPDDCIIYAGTEILSLKEVT